MINIENGCDESMGQDNEEKAVTKEYIQQTIYNVSSGGTVYVANDNANMSVETSTHSNNRNNIIQTEKFKNNKKQDYIDNWNSRLFLHIDNDERPLTLADAFIMPDFDYHIKVERYKFGDSDSLDNVIQKFMEYAASLNMLIIGTPGMGKSSIVSWIANQYKDNDNIIILRFRDWKIEKLSNGLLNASCTSLSCENEDLENKMLILDGFDEIKAVDIRNSLLRNFFNDILDYKNFKFIITSRPDYIDFYKFQNIFTLLPFGIDKIKQFYQIIKESELDINKINYNNLNVLGIPVILYMALMVEIDITEDATKSELYNRIFAEEGGIFDKFCYQGIAYDNGSQPLRDSENKKTYLRFLGDVAFKMFEKNDLCIRKDECQIPEIEFYGNSMQVLEFPIKHLFENTKSNIEFIHKSIYEYFVAEYFYKILCDTEKYTTIEKIASVWGRCLREKVIEKEIIELLKYKVKNSNVIVGKFGIFIRVFNLMINNGMTYYTKDKCKKVIQKEMNVFVNMLELLHLWEEKHLQFDDCIFDYLLYNKHIGLNLKNIDLRRKDLGGINFVGVNLSNADLEGVFLSGANLKNANLCEINLKEAYLNQTNLSKTNLSNANLNKAQMKYIDLSKANLTSANLTSADLMGADLMGANLTSANLIKADLTSANLIKANLTNVCLVYVNIEGSIWLKDDIQKLLHQLKEAKFEYIIIEEENKQKNVYKKQLFPDEK